MTQKPARLPFGLLIAALVLFIIGAIFRPVGGLLIDPEQMETNIFLLAIPFLTIFVAIILTFIFSIFLVARALNGRIQERVYRPIETVILAGIALGIIGMFQPFTIVLYRIGFHVLLFSTLSFIVWSHISPRRSNQNSRNDRAAAHSLEAGARE